MDTSMKLSVGELLAEAGIKFTVVDRCPHPRCEVCVDSRLSAAA